LRFVEIFFSVATVICAQTQIKAALAGVPSAKNLQLSRLPSRLRASQRLHYDAQAAELANGRTKAVFSKYLN